MAALPPWSDDLYDVIKTELEKLGKPTPDRRAAVAYCHLAHAILAKYAKMSLHGFVIRVFGVGIRNASLMG